MKIVLITGATSGIGLATAYLFAEKKYHLVLCGRNMDKLNELEKEFQEITKVYTLQFDVRNFEEVNNSWNSLPLEFKNVHILINNAGNAHGLSSIQDGNIADWDAMIDGNVQGLLYVSKLVIPKMIERKSGHIVNISSVAGKTTYANGAVYCASKKAVEAISEGMRLDLTQHGIKVTNIAPGAVETNFSLVRFKGDTEKAKNVYAGFDPLKPEDVASAIIYAVEAPANVTIADLTILAAAQASPTVIYRK
ncbi:MAG: SDR family NAD(P)-dependent oxidoreductase [Bacteroidota bacterium]|nr:SDR family NAD(P)-dependent oxidoreductase [Bacteroidota bacterium]